MTFDGRKTCSTCLGTGNVGRYARQTCPTCEGFGSVLEYVPIPSALLTGFAWTFRAQQEAEELLAPFTTEERERILQYYRTHAHDLRTVVNNQLWDPVVYSADTFKNLMRNKEGWFHRWKRKRHERKQAAGKS